MENNNFEKKATIFYEKDKKKIKGIEKVINKVNVDWYEEPNKTPEKFKYRQGITASLDDILKEN